MGKDGSLPERSRLALVGEVGRSSMRLGLTDEEGRLRHETVRQFDPFAQPTVSGAISDFARALGMAGPPRRLAIAVSGNTRGDTIAVTNGHWRISRSGLAAMIQAPPLLLNDFAATAWAISSGETSARFDSIVGGIARPQAIGSFLIIGVGIGLGVALLSRNEDGSVTVVPTEAGHSAFPSGLKEAEPVLAMIGARDGFATGEMLLSESGLLAIYNSIGKLRGASPAASDADHIVRIGTHRCEDIAGEAVSLFAKALWHFSANVALALGAWDGVILTGSLAAAVRTVLQRPDVAQHFHLAGPFRRELAAMPRSLVTFRQAELEGAAVALLVEDARQVRRQLGIAA